MVKFVVTDAALLLVFPSLVHFLAVGMKLMSSDTIPRDKLVEVHNGVQSGVPSRNKRGVITIGGWKLDTVKCEFTDVERQAILDIHNDIRREINATNMRELSWNATLEAAAQEWANGCDFKHNYGNDYGENLSSQPSFFNETVVVQNWDSEKQHYTFSSHSCDGGVCGHYLQVVLAESSTVGCGIKFCPTMKTITSAQTYFTVCNYSPATNKGSSRPYEEGERCSNCPADMPSCFNYLCRQSTGGSTTSTTTTPASAQTPRSSTITSSTSSEASTPSMVSSSDDQTPTPTPTTAVTFDALENSTTLIPSNTTSAGVSVITWTADKHGGGWTLGMMVIFVISLPFCFSF